MFQEGCNSVIILNMNKITCIIIEDQVYEKDNFIGKIDTYFSDRLIVKGTAETVKEGVVLINEYNPDIVFLDIGLPVEDGFELFKYFKTITFEVIFTTGFVNYAVDAIKVAAFDYLLKPINEDALRNTLDRYEKQKQNNTNHERIETLVSSLQMGSDINQKVAFPVLNGCQMEKLNDITYCEADGNYTRVHVFSGRILLVSKTLKDVEDLVFSDHFYRIHKSFLVNLNYVKSFSRVENSVMLENNQVLPVSNRKNTEFLNILSKRRRKD